MTNFELSLKKFENRFEYSYLCQPDGGLKTVIFSYRLRGRTTVPSIRFEAESLELAFNHAISSVGLLPCSSPCGLITEFNSSSWNTVEHPTHYKSLNGLIKCLEDELQKEKLRYEKPL